MHGSGRLTAIVALATMALLVARKPVAAQPRPGAAPSTTPRSSAPVDLTGYWVSVVTQDWRWRMVTPPKGDYGSVPITLEAKKLGDAWDPAKDEAAGEPCKAYGAPAIMSMPTRLHVTWADDRTVKVETDTGKQTRMLHFGDWKPQESKASLQGQSVATWEVRAGDRSGGASGGSLKVVTKNLRAGYLRKNGVPYSENAVVTEYWDVASERNGDRWITITSIVEDPKYLRTPYVTAVHFRKETDGSRWDPTPCAAR